MSYSDDATSHQGYYGVRGAYDSPVDPPPAIRSPSDILAEAAAELKRKQDELLSKCNDKLPRKRGDQGRVYLGNCPENVYSTVVAELKRVGWCTHISYNNLVIEFPQEVSVA